jgi:putative endopeptidase
MRSVLVSAPVLVVVVVGAACGSTAPSPAAPNQTPTAMSTPAVENVTLADVGLDAERLDRKADPCDDFYRFSCGNWLDTKEIPSDSPMYGTFQEIFDKNEATLHDILEKAAHSPGDDPVAQKIGTYYAACMDEAEIETHGATPLDPLFAAVKKVKDAKSLLPAVAVLHRAGVDVFFTLGPVQDKKDATQMIAQIGQGGIGLPDRDYYLDESPPAKELREAYRAHLQRMFALIGLAAGAAKQAAADTLAIELAIAKSHKTRVELRDEVGTYNRIDRAGLAKASPKLAWDDYFSTLGIPDVQKINTVSTAYVARFDTIATFFTPKQWRSYLTVHALEDKAGLLAHRFVDESFAFQKRILGLKELRVRWKRCVSLVDRHLGELLAQPYVAQAFSGDSKPAALALIRGIAFVFGENLDKISWMDEATKAKAHDKLAKIALHIGYPSKWRSYDFALDPKGFAKNALVAVEAETTRLLGEIGKPVDREEWALTPPTVNAYYDAALNEEVFPPASSSRRSSAPRRRCR